MSRGPWWATSVGILAGVLLLVAGTPLASAARPIPQAAPAKTPRTAPLDPRFVLWQAMSGLEPVLRSAGPHGLGLRPLPVQGYTPSDAASPPPAVTYSASYDLRTQGKLPAVRNQGAYGTCWSFAAMGSLESSALPGEALDLSEDNMVLTSGFNVGGASSASQLYNSGGNLNMATAYLTRWGGPVYETDDAYADGATPGGLTARRHVQDVDWYAGRTSATDNDRIKYAVSTYGGTAVTMYWTDAAYDSATMAYYYGDSTTADSTNHGVVVVGWNDDYAAGNFATTPAGNGAFIVRNSWGSSWGDGGYFYVSYYDTRFARQYTIGSSTNANYAASYEAGQAATNYGAVYQYDPLGSVSSLGLGSTMGWGANVFTATAPSALNAVGFYANAPNTAYEVWEGPSTANLTKLTSGTMAQMGFHTVSLPAGTTVANGATFVVALKLTTPGYSWPLAFEYPLANYSSGATAAAGQSFYSSNGSAWSDLTGFRANANLCIKAYASRIPASSCSYGFAANGTSGWKTTAQTVTIGAAGGDGTGRAIFFSQNGGATWSTSTAAAVDVAVSTEGAHHVEYYVKDSLATEITHDAGYVNIDTVKPATTDDHLTADLADPATITLTPSDATSGVSRTEYKIDGAATYTTGVSVVLGAGSHTVIYRSTDVAGNVETDKTVSVTVTGVKPVSQTTYSGFAATAATGWHSTSPQTVTITASGGTGAGRTIHASQDGGVTWSTTTDDTATIVVSTDGAHHVEYYASDSGATESTHDAGWVNIDSVAPVTTDDHPVTAVMGPATITLEPSDATSGMAGGAARTEYKVDGAAAYSTGTTVVLGEGTHTLDYRSRDAAGNLESPDKTCRITVMNPLTPQSACGYVFAPDAVSGWKNTAETITITAAGGSGTGRTIHYSLDGGATWSTAAADKVDIPVATQGAHHLEFSVSDSMAEEPVHDAGWVNIDSGRPATTARKVTVRKGHTVTLKFRVNDGVPGCGRAVVKLQIRKRTKVVKTFTLGTRPTNAALTCKYAAKLKRGAYTYRILATDVAGNVAAKTASVRLRVR